MVIWRGWGILALVIAAVWLFVGVGVQTMIANGMYPESPDALELAIFNNPMMNLVLGAAALGAAVSLWFWGRWINREGNAHTVFFIPVQFWGPLIGLGALIGSGVTAMAPAGDTSRLASKLEDTCVDHVIDLTHTQCSCMGEQYSAGLNAEMIFAFDRVMSRPLGSDPDATIIDQFMTDEMSRFSETDQQTFISTTEAMFDQCLPA